jgi:hypothetical protein
MRWDRETVAAARFRLPDGNFADVMRGYRGQHSAAGKDRKPYDHRRFPPHRAQPPGCRRKLAHGRSRLPRRRPHLRHARLCKGGLRQSQTDARAASGFCRRTARNLPSDPRGLGPHGDDSHPACRGERGRADRRTPRCLEASHRQKRKVGIPTSRHGQTKIRRPERTPRLEGLKEARQALIPLLPAENKRYNGPLPGHFCASNSAWYPRRRRRSL